MHSPGLIPKISLAVIPDNQSPVDSRSPGGGIGRRCGLKIRFPKGSAGSSPALGTNTTAKSRRIAPESGLAPLGRFDLAGSFPEATPNFQNVWRHYCLLSAWQTSRIAIFRSWFKSRPGHQCLSAEADRIGDESRLALLGHIFAIRGFPEPTP